VCANGHVGIGHAGLNELEGCIGAFVDDLNVFLREGDIHLPEFDVELELLFNLGFGDVEIFALQVRTTDQAIIVANCYSRLQTSSVYSLG